MEGLKGEFGAALVAGSCQQECEVGERWVGEGLAHFQFLRDETIEVVMPCELD